MRRRRHSQHDCSSSSDSDEETSKRFKSAFGGSFGPSVNEIVKSDDEGAKALQAFEMYRVALANQASRSAFGVTGTKKQREVYVGNLPIDNVTTTLLREKFNELIRAIPDFARKYNAAIEPVRDVQLSSSGTFAFVEFASEELCATALLFDKVIIGTRRINCGRPQGYTEPTHGAAKPLDVSYLIEKGLLPTAKQKNSECLSSSAVAAAKTERRQRELYVGNLPHGTASEAIIVELFTPATKMLPQYDPAKGEPVINVSLNRENRFAFVEESFDCFAKSNDFDANSMKI